MLLLFLIDLYLLILTVISQIVHPTAEFSMPIGILAKEEKAELKHIQDLQQLR